MGRWGGGESKQKSALIETRKSARATSLLTQNPKMCTDFHMMQKWGKREQEEEEQEAMSRHEGFEATQRVKRQKRGTQTDRKRETHRDTHTQTYTDRERRRNQCWEGICVSETLIMVWGQFRIESYGSTLFVVPRNRSSYLSSHIPILYH